MMTPTPMQSRGRVESAAQRSLRLAARWLLLLLAVAAPVGTFAQVVPEPLPYALQVNSYSQLDARWGIRQIGEKPKKYQWMNGCGCYITSLAMLLEYHSSFPAPEASMPWFDLCYEGLGCQREFSPQYVNVYLTRGRRPGDPDGSRPPIGWGFSDAAAPDGCGVQVYPWALERAAEPGILGVQGVKLTAHAGLDGRDNNATKRWLIDKNLRARKPVFAILNTGSGYHTLVVVGWDAKEEEYVILDPLGGRKFIYSPMPVGNIYSGNWLCNYPALGCNRKEKFEGWLGKIEEVHELNPSMTPSRYIMVIDDPEPIELMGIDHLGRRTGHDPATQSMVNESPGIGYTRANAWADPLGIEPVGESVKSLFIRDPVDGGYGIVVTGTGNGPFTLRFGTGTGESESAAVIASTVTGTIATGQVRQYEVEYAAGAVTSVTEVPSFAPRARAGNDRAEFVNAPVSFNGGLSFQIDGQIASHEWDFGDGGTASGVAVQHAYTAPGTYTVTLTVRNAPGQLATDTATVRIVEPIVTAGRQTARASVGPAGEELPHGTGQGYPWSSERFALTPDGRFLAFESRFVSGATGGPDTNGTSDIFVKDLQSCSVERISLGQTTEPEGVRGAYSPTITPDGRHVAFMSSFTDLVEGETNLDINLFVRDRATGITERIPVTTSTGTGSGKAAFSDDGRYIAFDGYVAHVPTDQYNPSDVYVRDRTTGAYELISVNTVPGGVYPGGVTGYAGSGLLVGMSADGRHVAFVSQGTYIAGAVPEQVRDYDLFIRDRQTQTTVRHRFPIPLSANLRISRDFRSVASWGTDGQVYAWDLATGATEMVSVSSAGTPSDDPSFSFNGKQYFGDQQTFSISPDGRYVAFWSRACNLLPGGNGGTCPVAAPHLRTLEQLYVRDRQTQTTTRESVSTAGTLQTYPIDFDFLDTLPLVLDSGAVAFESKAANLVAGDTNGMFDIFLRGADLGSCVGGEAPPTAPVASVGGPYLGFAADGGVAAAIEFDGSASIDPTGAALTATWDFGDGTPPLSGTALTATHAYAQPGNYTVTLAVARGATTSAAVTTKVDVLPAPGFDGIVLSPGCGAPASTLSLAGAAITANASLIATGWDLSRGPPLLAPGVVTLSSGDTLSLPTSLPDLTFRGQLAAPVVPGELTATLANGASATFRSPCPPPGNQAPAAHAGGPSYRATVGVPVTLDGSLSSDPEGSPLTYQWDFGDRSPAGSGVRPTYVYPAVGSYFVTLIVNDGELDSGPEVGSRSFAVVDVGAASLPPVANNDDLGTTSGTTPVSGNVVANDVPDGVGNAIDPATVDLDTVAPGQQNSVTSLQGSWVASATGVVTFTAASAFSGTATIGYTVRDTLAVQSNVATIVASVTLPPDVASISGTVFDDTDGNGVRDDGERGLLGVVVALVDGSGTVLRIAATDGSGAYSFPAVSAGSYRIRLLSWPAGGAPTTPVDVAVTVSAGGSVTVDLMGIHMAVIEIPTLSHTALALLVLALSAAAWWRRATRRRLTMARRGS